MSSKFTNLSVELTKKLSKKEKKDNGIFFTPSSISHKLIHSIHLSSSGPLKIVEPSCGSGEFIEQLLRINTQDVQHKIIGIEKHPQIYEAISKKYNKDEVELYPMDFMDYNEKADLFIGNPPYFVVPKKNVPKAYEKYMEGRPNIFVLFILHSLHLLEENGIMAYVIPTSFLNSKYYDKTRKFIYDKFTIIDILPFPESDFIETEQKTLGLIVKKKIPILGNNDRFTFRIRVAGTLSSNENTLLFTDVKSKIRLTEIYQNATTLRDLGMKVKTGSFVWNQHKDILMNCDDQKDLKLLVYNSNIISGEFKKKDFKNKEKKQYVDTDDYEKGPMIVVNRGNGNSNYKFTYCYLGESLEEKKYLIENHLNVIYGPEEKLRRVLDSFRDPRTKEFLELFSGNNGLSKTELENILPILN
jgi:adenine-specific DNA-methyltransferase